MTRADSMTGATQVTICVCTHRRAHLARTLASLDASVRHAMEGGGEGAGANLRAEVVVVDNDAAASAAPLVEAFETELAVRYAHVPGSNISLARNACLDLASHALVAFVDDDERVAPHWLAHLLARRAETGADVVLGPVHARYPAGAPRWMRETEPHTARPVFVAGEIRTGYTCNVLFDTAAPALHGRRFDLARGRTGGEDTAFFSAAWEGGATFAFAPDAWVEEDVTPERMSFAWLARRRFRSGQTHAGLVARRMSGSVGRMAAAGQAGAKLAYCALAAAAAPRTARRNAALLRGALHAGAVASLMGRRDLTLYDAQPRGPSDAGPGTGDAPPSSVHAAPAGADR